MSRRVFVAGLGHVLLIDGAIGPYCAAHLLANCTFPGDVQPGTPRVVDHAALLGGRASPRIGGLVERVFVELTNRGVAWRPRGPGAPSQVWWEAPAGLRQVPA